MYTSHVLSFKISLFYDFLYQIFFYIAPEEYGLRTIDKTQWDIEFLDFILMIHLLFSYCLLLL